MQNQGWIVTTAFALIAISIFASPGLADQPVRQYTAGLSPASASAGATGFYSVTITNSASSTKPLGETTVDVPLGFSVDGSSLSVSATGGKTWAASLSGSTITAIPGPADAGNQRLNAGESFTLSFHATAPCDGGVYIWTTAAGQDTTSATTTPFQLVGLQPSVTVSGSCGFGGFSPGDYCTFTQGGWGAAAHGSNPGSIRDASFSAIYPSGVSVGGPNSMTFSSSADVEAYLPAGGPANSLSASLLNPTSSSSGVFGGQVLSLRLNLDYNAAGALGSLLPYGPFASLKLANTGSIFDGQTVEQILAAAETALGGGGGSISSLNTIVGLLNEGFDNCAVTDWAQSHLTPGN